MIKSLLRFMFGSVTVSVTGDVERFLGYLSYSKMKYWNMERTNDGTLCFSLYRRSFIKLRPIIRKTRSKIHIIKKSGLPQLTYGYRFRYGLVIGALVFVVMIYISSLFVWQIDIKGCEKISRQEVLTRLSECGINIGSFKSALDIKSIENIFLQNYNKISWLSINIKGTTAYVEIREVNEKPEIINTDEPCSIYAARDGIIASIQSYMGYNVVSVGDTVTAGDLIVSGNYTDKYGVDYKLHSYAKVMAYTVHSHSVTIPYNNHEHMKTGKIKNKYSLKLTRFIIPLYFKENIIYNNYDITKSEKHFRIGENFVLPISILKTTYTEVYDCVCKKTKETALADAYEQLRDFEYNLIGIQILNREYEESDDENGVTVKVMLDCYEDIGISKKIE